MAKVAENEAGDLFQEGETPEVEVLESLDEVDVIEAKDDDESLALTPMADAMLQTFQTTISPQQVDILVDRLMARIEAEKRLRIAVLSKTNHLDWVGFKAEGEGEDEYIPYLIAAGCKKVMTTFGVELETNGTPVLNRQEDGSILATVSGRTRARFLSDAWWPVLGSRWSGDPFFTGKEGDDVYDPGDLMKSCLTNFYQEGVKSALALDTVTWDDLRGAGVNIDRVKKVQFRGKGGGSADVMKGPHIDVFVPYQRKDLQGRLKKAEKRTVWNPDGKFWSMALTKKNLNMARDMEAEEGASVRVRIENCEGDPEAYVAKNG